MLYAATRVWPVSWDPYVPAALGAARTTVEKSPTRCGQQHGWGLKHARACGYSPSSEPSGVWSAGHGASQGRAGPLGSAATATSSGWLQQGRLVCELP